MLSAYRMKIVITALLVSHIAVYFIARHNTNNSHKAAQLKQLQAHELEKEKLNAIITESEKLYFLSQQEKSEHVKVIKRDVIKHVKNSSNSTNCINSDILQRVNGAIKATNK